MNRLLDILEWLCGAVARDRVFEPLVADWQREWHDARGARRISIAASGSGALLWSIVRSLQPAHAFTASPVVAFALALFLFAALGAALALQPMSYRWLGAGLKLSWYAPYGPLPDLAYFVPYTVATTMGVALLPVTLLATAAGWRWRQRAMAVGVSLVMIAVVDGWVAPAVMYERNRPFIERLPESHRGLAIRSYAPTSEVIGLAWSTNKDLASAARLGFRDKLELFFAAIAFALLGTAIGVARRPSVLNIGVLAILSWWLGAWVLYNALQHWSSILALLLSLPRSYRPWIAPTFFVLIAGLALAYAKKGGTDVPPALPFAR